MAATLSPSQCILLTVHLASSAAIKPLHSFTPSRLDVLDPDLVLRILLTYLPESLDPREYSTYVSEVATRLYLDVDRQDVPVDISPVKDISEEEAKKKVKKLHLLEIVPPNWPPRGPKDSLTRWLCHRAYRIDEQTGLLNLLPALIEPFLEKNEYLRTWYISVALPLVRLEFEYYPHEAEENVISLGEFEKVDGRAGVDLLLQKTLKQDGTLAPNATPSSSSGKGHTIARDVKGLVGPWMYGDTARKRRRLEPSSPQYKRNNYEVPEEQSTTTTATTPSASNDSDPAVDDLTDDIRKIELSGVQASDKTSHTWECLYHWLVQTATTHFPLAVELIESWDGPRDIDTADLLPNQLTSPYLPEELQRKLDLSYAQSCFAACYASPSDTQQTVRGAHAILARLAELLDFLPPPDLATSVDSLPRIERHTLKLEQSERVADFLVPGELLKPEHPLTSPRMETYMLLQMMVYSAYQFAGLGFPISLVGVARLQFYKGREEQEEVLRRVLKGLSKEEAGKEGVRGKVEWLWGWGIRSEEGQEGAGVLGKVGRVVMEEECLRWLVGGGCKSFFSCSCSLLCGFFLLHCFAPVGRTFVRC